MNVKEAIQLYNKQYNYMLWTQIKRVLKNKSVIVDNKIYSYIDKEAFGNCYDGIIEINLDQLEDPETINI